MKKISAVVFDFGGVMTTTIMPERVRPCVERLGVSWRVLEEDFASFLYRNERTLAWMRQPCG